MSSFSPWPAPREPQDPSRELTFMDERLLVATYADQNLYQHLRVCLAQTDLGFVLEAAHHFDEWVAVTWLYLEETGRLANDTWMDTYLSHLCRGAASLRAIALTDQEVQR